ncbi:MAG: flagellar export protein FliJ [Planctomycetota bacterium]
MKRFEYRLERVQKLRERIRERRRLLHAEAVQYRQKVEEQIQSIENAREAEKEVLRTTLSHAEVMVDSIIRSRAYDGLLGNYRRHLDRQLEQVQQVVEVRRQELVHSERDVRILEKLEERMRLRYNETVDRAEQSDMDELARQSVARREELFGKS